MTGYTRELKITVIDTTTVTTIEPNQDNLQWLFYPNPAGEFVYFENVISGSILKMYDTSGKLVYETSIYQKNYKLNLVDLQSGTYFVSLESENAQKGVRKLIKN